MKWFYVYILQSEKDNKFYTGYTSDLKRRIDEHNSGISLTTNNRRPLKLMYSEACLDAEDAKKWEKYLKTTYGKRYINKKYFDKNIA